MSPRARTSLIVAALAALPRPLSPAPRCCPRRARLRRGDTAVQPTAAPGFSAARALVRGSRRRRSAGAPARSRALRAPAAAAGGAGSSAASTRSRQSSAPRSLPGRRARTGSSSSARSFLAARSSSSTSGSHASGRAPAGARPPGARPATSSPTPPTRSARTTSSTPSFAPGLPVFIAELPLPRRGRRRRPTQLEALRADRTAARAAPLRGRAAAARPPASRRGAPSPRRRGWRRTTSTRSSPTRSAATTRATRPAAFSRLGPLTRRFPQSATVRFHLGRPAALAGRREGGETAAAARSGGRARQPDRAARRSGTSRSWKGRDRLTRRWA